MQRDARWFAISSARRSAPEWSAATCRVDCVAGAQARAIFTRRLAAAEDGALGVWRLRALQQLGTVDLVAGPVLDRNADGAGRAVEQGAGARYSWLA
jgi:hypothetical protein